MPAPTNYKIHIEKQTPETILYSALDRLRDSKKASSAILRRNIALKEHTAINGSNCIGPNGTQIGVEVKFYIQDKTEKTCVCTHCFKPGLVEQK